MERGPIHCVEEDAVDERVDRTEWAERRDLGDARVKRVAASGRPRVRADELVNARTHVSLQGSAGTTSFNTKTSQATEEQGERHQ
eukprot:1031424-Pleurochrysis_carterae.AAC.1